MVSGVHGSLWYLPASQYKSKGQVKLLLLCKESQSSQGALPRPLALTQSLAWASRAPEMYHFEQILIYGIRIHLLLLSQRTGSEHQDSAPRCLNNAASVRQSWHWRIGTGCCQGQRRLWGQHHVIASLAYPWAVSLTTLALWLSLVLI